MAGEEIPLEIKLQQRWRRISARLCTCQSKPPVSCAVHTLERNPVIMNHMKFVRAMIKKFKEAEFSEKAS